MSQSIFCDGVNAMARSCHSAVQLVKDGKWTVDQLDKWLLAVLENDPKYFETESSSASSITGWPITSKERC
jgi:hypothetical protein